MATKNYTYDQYLQVMGTSPGLKLGKQQSAMIINRFQQPSVIPLRFAPVIYVLDYATKKYIHVDESCFELLGFNAAYFIEGGLDSYKSKWHPADFGIINSRIFPVSFEFISKIPQEEYANYIFSYNHRTLTAKGDYITVLQRSSYIPGNTNGIPGGVIGVVFDITHFKTDVSITHTIERTVQFDGALVNELVFKQTYPVIELSSIAEISKREFEVLRYVSEGFSSKQIAHQLQISINTVNNHRKSMLKKSGFGTLSELINHAIKQGLI